MSAHLPRLFAGARRRLVIALVLLGLLHSGLVFLSATVLHRALTETQEPHTPWRGIGALIGLGSLVFFLRLGESFTAEVLGQHYLLRVRAQLLRRVFDAPLEPAPTTRVGGLLTRLTGDLNAIRNWISSGFARVISASLATLGLLAAIAYFAPLIAMLMSFLIVGVGTVAGFAARRLRADIRDVRSNRGRLSNSLAEALPYASVYRHLGIAGDEMARVLRRGRRMAEAQIRRARTTAILRRLPDLVSGLALALVALALTQARGNPGNTPQAPTSITLLLVGLLVSQLRELAAAWSHRLAYLEARRRLESALNRPVLSPPNEPRMLPGTEALAVSFRTVGFGSILSRCTASAAPGERIWITGPSGHGKSTLLRLAARLTDPESGEVALDSIPVRELDNQALSRAVRLVSPDLPLLRGTVRRNLLRGLPTSDAWWFSQVTAVCGLSGSDSRLTEGLETRLTAGGTNLGSGLRAQIALARALLARPRLLLIDDPAFLLDAAARDALRRGLALSKATVLLVGSSMTPPLALDQVWLVVDGTLSCSRLGEGSVEKRPAQTSAAFAAATFRPTISSARLAPVRCAG